MSALRAFAGWAALLAAGCGYGPANSANDPLGPYEVVPERATVPDASSLVSAAAGARAELARAGQLGRCDRAPGGCGVVSIQVTRVDESGVGFAARDRPEGRAPRARGSRVTVTGRARVLVDGRVERETPDVAVSETVARLDHPPAALLAREDALRVAANRLGARLVRLLLGHPEPTME